MRRPRPPATVALTLLVLLFLFRAPAQAQSGTGEIWGRVADTAGRVIRGAEVTATNVDSGWNRRTTTDASGRFAFPLLPPAQYEVTAARDPYAARRQDGIALLPGARMAIVLQLREARLPETIALNPFPPILESARTHASAIVADSEIHGLPVIGLRYLRLAQLTPAVSLDSTTGGLSVTALPSSDNRLVVDGFDQTSSVTGEPIGREGPARVPYQISLMSVDAYRINTSAAPAATGGADGALIDATTRAGSNEFHGAGYEFFGDRGLNAQKLIDERAGTGRPAYRSNQFGALVGGPLVTDHQFFLLNADGLRRTAAPTATVATAPFAPVGASAIAPLQSAFARIARDDRQDLLLARTDHQFGGQRLTLSYSDQQFTGTPIDAARMQPAITSSGTADVRTRSGGVALADALGGHVFNEARGHYETVRDGETAAPMPGAVVLQGGSFVGETGSSLYGPHVFDTRRLEGSEDLSVVAAGHTVTLGGSVLRDRNRTQLLGSTTFGFQSIPAFAAGRPDWVTQAAETAAVPVTVSRLSGYLQDTWRASESITVDLGARYDLERFSTPLPATDRNNWAPRVGIAIAPGEHRHVFRAAYGLMYGTTPALIPALAAAYPAGSPAVIVAQSFTAPRVHQASAGWEFERYRVGSLGVEYLFAKGEQLARPIETHGAITYQSSGGSLYNGVALHIRARVLQQLFYTAAYTFSRMDETPLEPIVPPGTSWNERYVLSATGRAIDARRPGSTDQQHNLSLSALYNTAVLVTDRHGLSKRLLENWDLALVYTLASGQPYSALVDGDLNGDGNAFDDLLPGTLWNQFRLPWQASLDPRVSREFSLGGTRRIALIWQAFNVANRPNFTSVDAIAASLNGSALVPNPLFGRKTGEAAGRTMQLAARFTF